MADETFKTGLEEDLPAGVTPAPVYTPAPVPEQPVSPKSGGVSDALKNFLGLGGDSGVPGTDEDYVPSYQRNIALAEGQVPANWGDILSDLLGGLANVNRARRRQQAAALDREFERVKDDPEARAAFLERAKRTAPWWIDYQGGVSDSDFRGSDRRARQDAHGKVVAALKELRDEAAQYTDPNERDQFIQSQLAELEKDFPDFAKQIEAAFPKTVGADDGKQHYYLAGSQATARSDESAGQTFINEAEARALKIQDPQARAKFMRERMKTFARLFPGMESEFPQPDKNGVWSDEALGGPATAQDQFAAHYGSQFGGKIPTIREFLQATNPALLAQLQAAMGTNFAYALDLPVTKAWDTTGNGSFDVTRLDPYTERGVTHAENVGKARLNFRNDPRYVLLQSRANLIARQISEAESQERSITSQLNVETDPAKQKALKAQLDALSQRINTLNQQQDALVTQMAQMEQDALTGTDSSGGQSQGSASTPGGGTPQGPSAPTISQAQVDTALQRFRVGVAAGKDPVTGQAVSRADLLRGLVRGWAGMSPQQRSDFARNGGMSPAEKAWLDAGGKGEPPSSKPTPGGAVPQGRQANGTQAQTAPVNAPASAAAINAAVAIVRRATNPQQRQQAIQRWLAPLWRRITDPQVKRNIRKSLNLSPAEWSLLEGAQARPTPQSAPGPTDPLSGAPSGTTPRDVANAAGAIGRAIQQGVQRVGSWIAEQETP
jgi:hypothetical protein